MAILWMDTFTIYGTDAGRVGRMLDGVYAEAAVSLIADPDPTAGGGMVVQAVGNLRKVLPAAVTTIGVAARFWTGALPAVAGGYGYLAHFRDVNNVPHCFITVDPSGNIQAYRQDNAGAVLLGQTANPVLTTNAWKHVESKVFLDAAAGTIDVRVEGVNVLSLAGIRTTTNVAGAVLSCQNVFFGRNGGTGAVFNIKDLIVWDNSTAFNNTFLGSCQVLRLAPDADVSLNWTPSAGGTGFNLINELTPDDDGTYISAGVGPIPAAYKCSLSDVPLSVTSVRAVMPIHRSRKIDGGDGNIQVGLISGASTGLGTDRPITTAYTYWWDIYNVDPNGGAAWTRASLNAVTLQINRTL